MKFTALFLVAILGISCAFVYEANSSDDVTNFLSDDPDSNRVIIFYDEVQEVAQKQVKKLTEDITSIFLPRGDQDRLQERWVDDLNDKVNLMRIDRFNPDNQKMVDLFEIKETPWMVIFENGIQKIDEKINDLSFDKVKEALIVKNAMRPPPVSFSGSDNTQSAPSQAPQQVVQQYSPPQFVEKVAPQQAPVKEEPKWEPKPYIPPTQSPEAIALADAETQLIEAQRLNTQSQQEVQKATQALEEAKKRMVEYAEVEKAKQNAQKAKEATDQALRAYEEARRQLDNKFRQVRNDIRDFEKDTTGVARQRLQPAQVIAPRLQPTQVVAPRPSPYAGVPRGGYRRY